MTHPQGMAIRRRADGSIDTGHYVARAEAIHRADTKRRWKNLLRLLKRVAALLRDARAFSQNSAPPSGTLRSIAPSTTAPSSSGKPSVSTTDMNLPICRGGKLTTANTWRPTSVSGA